MFRSALSTLKKNNGFNMIELMVVVVIVGILAIIAVPIYARYAKNSRLTEATSRMGELLTAAKMYAVANENNSNPNDAVWPAYCNVPGFIGDCSPTKNFTFSLNGAANGQLKIIASGIAGSPTSGVTVTMEIEDPTQKPTLVVMGF